MDPVQQSNDEQDDATAAKVAEIDKGDETLKDNDFAMDKISTERNMKGGKEEMNDSAEGNEGVQKIDGTFDATSNEKEQSENESQDQSATVGHDVQKQGVQDANDKAELDDAMDEDMDYVKDEEPRRTKRRRSSVTFSRYSPGEGGGLKRNKTDLSSAEKASPDAVVSRVSVKSTETKERNEPKKKDKKKSAKLDASNPKSTTRQYPIYTWSSAGTPNGTKTIHQSLTIDFGPLSSEDQAISPDGSWKCLKCHHSNLSSKSRCSVCLSWKGGKRENYSRRGSDGTTHSTSSSVGVSSSKMEIQVGDDVLVSSGDTPWKDLNRFVARAEVLERDADADNGEVSMCYDDPVSNEPGLAALDPYVARVTGMWEEVEEMSDMRENSSNDSRESRMMIQTRWYFKREDMEGIALTMDGQEVKNGIVADMSVRDVILSDQTDLNSVSCILGKASVTCLNLESKAKIKGGFVCRYQMKLDEDESNGILSPILESGVDSKEVRRSSDAASSEDEVYSSTTDVFSPSAYGAQLSPRRVISEGPTVGKIKVGPEHQAVILDQFNADSTSLHLTQPLSDRNPIKVWNPAETEANKVDAFIAKACSILSTSLGQTPFHELNHVESPEPTAEACKPREISIDCLLTQLHECDYKTDYALEKVSANPEKFLTVWTQEERDQFDSSFRVYRDALRMIAKNLTETKTCKDVIEYHYRFKLVENFRRFKAKKQEQAREMINTVEYRMLKERKAIEARNEECSDDDNESSDEEGGKANDIQDEQSSRDGPVNSRIRTWFKTGCSNDGAEGAAQQRRDHACNFLVQVKDQVGVDAYLTLAKCLKSFNSQTEPSLVDLKASAKDVMKSHPSLFDQFINFLPKEVR